MAHQRPGAQDSHFPKHYLRGCLCLLVTEGPSHGYELINRMHSLGLGGTDPSCAYKALRAMEHDGLVASDWERSRAGPSRRRYRITPTGEAWLRTWATGTGEQVSYLATHLQRLAPILESPRLTATGSRR